MININETLDEIEENRKKFYEEMGEIVGYLDLACPNCGRHRVEHWSGGKDICEKCQWCIQDNGYFENEFFDL